MNCALSPVQQRNLERAWNAKVLDRTGLILEIFGRRARTREGALQVEHAHLTYQKSRLVRSWTHLERQRGGFGFLGGPGETQIESDRRVIEERIARIEIRARQGQANAKAPPRQPQARALSDRGFGRLHQCRQVHAVQSAHAGERALRRHAVCHARSDAARRRPAARIARHPFRHGRLHLRPAHHAGGGVSRDAGGGDRGRSDFACARCGAWRCARRKCTTSKRCWATSASIAGEGRLIEVWNKIDQLDADERARLGNVAERDARRPVLVSALTGEGLERLTADIENRLSASRLVLDIALDPADGAGVSWLHRHTEVLTRSCATMTRFRMTGARRAPSERPRADLRPATSDQGSETT